MFPAISPSSRISSTGLAAEQMRLRVAANNLANINSTRDVDGGPYQRRQVVFATVSKPGAARGLDELQGVRVNDIVRDNAPPQSKHMPWHPDADANGMGQVPDISPMNEMVDIITATRSYEANLAAKRQSSKINQKTIELLKA